MKKNSSNVPNLKKVIPILLTLLIGISLSFGVSNIIKNNLEKKRLAQFRARTAGYTNTLENALDKYLDISNFLKGYLTVTQDLNRSNFKQYTQSILFHNPSIQALSWNPIVSEDMRKTYEKKAIADGFYDFSFTRKSSDNELEKSPNKDEYVVVYYIEPFLKNRSALGFDIASNSVRKQAIDTAIDSGNPIASARIKLVQETGNQFGILLLNPVYHSKIDINSVKSRRLNKKGLAVTVIRIKDAMDIAFSDLRDLDILVYLLDVTQATSPTYLYHRPLPNASKTSLSLPVGITELTTGMHTSKKVSFAGRQWQLILKPSHHFMESTSSFSSHLILFAGILLSFLLTGYMYLRLKHLYKIEQRVVQEKKNLERIADSEALFKATIQNISETIFITDDNGRFTYVSPNTEPIFGINAQNIAKLKDIHTLFKNSDPPLNIEPDTKAKEHIHFETKISDFHGKLHFLLINMKQISIKPGTMLFTCQDITERKLSETALHDSIDQLKQVYDSQLDAIFILNSETPARIIDCNKAACKIFGFESHRLIGSSIDQLHADKSGVQSFHGKLYPEIEKKGFLRNFEFAMKRKNGSLFPSEHTVVEIKNEDGIRSGWVSIVKDMTDIQTTKAALFESENRFRSLFEHAPLSYQSLDENGNFVEVNQTWLTIMGYTRKEVIGKNFSEFLHPDWQEHFKTNFPRFKAIGEILGVEFEMKKKDDSFILVSFHGKIAHKPDGSFKQTHCVFRDITEQRKMEDEKLILTAKLQQAQKMESIGTLAGGIAHDFNNILFPIVGYTEMVLEDLPKEDPLRESLEEVHKGALRARDLVKQILTFSRQDSDEIKQIKLQPVISEALKLIRSIIPTSIEVNLNLDKDCGPVNADPTKIHQVVMNLTTNAYHAMEETGGVLSVSLAQIEIASKDPQLPELSPGFYALLSVSDTGTGIDTAILNKIFDPFFTTKDPGRGTGMGLSAVHGIVKNFGGAIDVNSAQNQGSSFLIYLPIVDYSAPHAHKTIPDDSLHKGDERIMVVDDDQAIVNVVQQILDRLGYKVRSFTDSQEAFEAFKISPDQFDLVITDLTMPNMTGDKLSASMLEIRPDIPVLLCTGFSEKIAEEQMKSIGIKGLLMKPIAKSDLAQMVRSILDQTSK